MRNLATLLNKFLNFENAIYLTLYEIQAKGVASMKGFLLLLQKIYDQKKSETNDQLRQKLRQKALSHKKKDSEILKNLTVQSYEGNKNTFYLSKHKIPKHEMRPVKRDHKRNPGMRIG